MNNNPDFEKLKQAFADLAKSGGWALCPPDPIHPVEVIMFFENRRRKRWSAVINGQHFLQVKDLEGIRVVCSGNRKDFLDSIQLLDNPISRDRFLEVLEKATDLNNSIISKIKIPMYEESANHENKL